MAKKLSQKQVAECLRVFSMFDKDGNGKIDTQELGAMMRRQGDHPTKRELDEMV